MDKPILAAILSCSGTVLTDEEKRLFAAKNPLGISLFMRNIQNASQLKNLIKEIKEVIERDNVLIAIDEEGGRVTRLKPITKHKYVSATALANSPISYSQIHAKLIGQDMLRYGININFAPVVDKKTDKQSDVLQGRCLSSNTKKIVSYAKAIADTYMTMGICPCLKHIPGHFSTVADPHLNMIETDLARSDIERQTKYLQAFAEYPLIMSSHIVLKSIDKEYPVTMSKKCIEDFIRGYLGLKGFLLSDAIDMHALKGTIAEKAEKSLNAGIDAICYCSGKYEDLYNICQLQMFMSEKSLIRFAKIEKIINNTKKCTNISYLRSLYKNKFKDKLDKNYLYDATEVLHQMLTKGENK